MHVDSTSTDSKIGMKRIYEDGDNLLEILIQKKLKPSSEERENVMAPESSKLATQTIENIQSDIGI